MLFFSIASKLVKKEKKERNHLLTRTNGVNKFQKQASTGLQANDLRMQLKPFVSSSAKDFRLCVARGQVHESRGSEASFHIRGTRANVRLPDDRTIVRVISAELVSSSDRS